MTSPTVTLFRPTGPRELALVAQSGYRRWPPRLPDQPIFFPVTNEQYAVEIARDWNVPASGEGFVTRFERNCRYWYSQADCCLFQRPPLSKQESILSCPYSQNPIKATSTTTTTAMTFRFIFEPLRGRFCRPWRASPCEHLHLRLFGRRQVPVTRSQVLPYGARHRTTASNDGNSARPASVASVRR
ncbi:hypothetical protein [Roseateles noduli]|uniref:hypothetical protein n=1 Tax=Roseateles noduli TaxID=2052484 RepID=UPI003D658865